MSILRPLSPASRSVGLRLAVHAASRWMDEYGHIPVVSFPFSLFKRLLSRANRLARDYRSYGFAYVNQEVQVEWYLSTCISTVRPELGKGLDAACGPLDKMADLGERRTFVNSRALRLPRPETPRGEKRKLFNRRGPSCSNNERASALRGVPFRFFTEQSRQSDAGRSPG